MKKRILYYFLVLNVVLLMVGCNNKYSFQDVRKIDVTPEPKYTEKPLFIVPTEMGNKLKDKRYYNCKVGKEINTHKVNGDFRKGYWVKRKNNIKFPYVGIGWSIGDKSIDEWGNCHDGYFTTEYVDGGISEYFTSSSKDLKDIKKKTNTFIQMINGHGFTVGKKVKNEEFKTTVKHWYEAYDPDAFCETLDLQYKIESVKNRNGMLFYDMSINGEKYSCGAMTVMIDGKSVEYLTFGFDEGKKIKIKHVNITPVYFVPAEKLDENEYTIVKDNFNDAVYGDASLYATGIMELKNKDNGILLTKCVASNMLKRKEYVSNQADIFFNKKCIVDYNDNDFIKFGKEYCFTKEIMENLNVGLDSIYYIPVYDYVYSKQVN